MSGPGDKDSQEELADDVAEALGIDDVDDDDDEDNDDDEDDDEED